MKNLFRIVAIVTIALFGGITALHAQTKLGFVNTETIIQGMPEFKGIEAKLKGMQSSFQDTLRAMEINYKTRVETYQKQQATMSADARAKEEDQLKAIVDQYQQYQNDRLGPQGVLLQTQAQLVQPIKEKVQAAIRKVAEQEKLSAVMENSVLIYVDQKLDITYKVLDYLHRGTN
ncbi:MAG: OmpH family outer membrane protein [Bacteroidota bacterium]